MTISSTLQDTYTHENGEKKSISILAILHDIRIKLTNHVSRPDRENSLFIYNDTLQLIVNLLDDSDYDLTNIKQHLKEFENISTTKIDFYSDEMLDNNNHNYTNIAKNKDKQSKVLNLLIDAFRGLEESILVDYKNNSYRHRAMPKNFDKFLGMGGIWLGANGEMRESREDYEKDIIGLTEDESEFFNHLDSNAMQERVNKYIKNLEETYGIRVIYCAEHNDEKTKHWQFLYSNYDFDNHKSFKSDLSKFDLKKRGVQIQDMVHDNFKDLSFNYKGKDFSFQRGKSQEISSVDTKSMNQMQIAKIEDNKKLLSNIDKRIKKDYTNFKHLQTHITNANETIKELDSTIEMKQNEVNNLDLKIIDNIKKEEGLTTLLTDLNNSISQSTVELSKFETNLSDLKSEYALIKKDINLSSNEKSTILNEIDKKSSELKELIGDVKNKISFKKDLETNINSKIDIVFENSKGKIWLDKDKLREQIAKLVKFYLKINIQLKETLDIKTQNAKLLEDNTKLTKLTNSKDEKISDLKNENALLSHEMKEVYDLRKKEIALSKELKEVKQTHSTQLNTLNKALTQIETKSKNFNKYLSKKNLNKDFKEFEESEYNKNDVMSIILDRDDKSSKKHDFER